MDLKNFLIKLRNKYNLTQMEFAKKLGIKTGILAEWESGESEPNIEQLAKISSEFNISLDELINNSDDKEVENVFQAKTNSSSNVAKSKNLIQSNETPNNKKKKFLIVLPFIGIILLGLFAFILYKANNKSFSDDTKAIAQAESSVVKLHCYDYNNNEACTGSGFIAFDGETVVTNYHVACEGYTIKIATDKNTTYDVDSIITYSKEKDIAILKLTEDTKLTPLSFGNPDKIEKGEAVTAIGSPLGINNSISQGILSGRIPDKNFDILQFTAAISPGSSGGALFNSSGEVIGVTYASYENGQNLNLAIPVNIVSDLYDNKSMPTEINLLYRRTHPYVDYLNKATVATIKDINNHPSENAGNCLIKSVYISSFNGDSIETSTKAYICDDESYISGDFNYDQSNQNPSLLFIQWENDINDYSMIYCDESIDIGTIVTVVINHKYTSLGEFISDRKICKAIINQEK